MNPLPVPQAVEFLETFGPLTLSLEHRRAPCPTATIDLSEFWALQLRYSLVACVYEALGSANALRNAWQDVHVHQEAASKAVVPASTADSAPTLVDIPLYARHLAPGTHRIIQTPRPWDLQKQSFEEWLEKSSLTTLRQSALQFVHLELNLHSRGAPLWWERGWERSSTKYRPADFVESLWSTMWVNGFVGPLAFVVSGSIVAPTARFSTSLVLAAIASTLLLVVAFLDLILGVGSPQLSLWGQVVIGIAGAVAGSAVSRHF